VLKMIKNAGLGDYWQHYRLKGTQVEFTDATGRATLLGSSVLEPGFANSSSCMTCHSTATINSQAKSLSFAKSFSPFIGYVGIPDPNWFYTSPTAGSTPVTPLMYQLDFMWELINAEPRPDRCDTASNN